MSKTKDVTLSAFQKFKLTHQFDDIYLLNGFILPTVHVLTTIPNLKPLLAISVRLSVAI